MSKQDRQGVRKPSDLERKYDLAKIAKLESQLKTLAETVRQLKEEIASLKA